MFARLLNVPSRWWGVTQTAISSHPIYTETRRLERVKAGSCAIGSFWLDVTKSATVAKVGCSTYPALVSAGVPMGGRRAAPVDCHLRFLSDF